MARKMLIDGELGQTATDEKQYDFDLFVIGAGSGGVRASRTSAAFGAKVRGCGSSVSVSVILFFPAESLPLYTNCSFLRVARWAIQELFDTFAGLLSL